MQRFSTTDLDILNMSAISHIIDYILTMISVDYLPILTGLS